MAEENITREGALKILEASYDMYVTSKEEAIEARRNKKDKDGNRVYSEASLNETLELIDTMMNDIVKQYIEAGGNPEDLKKRKPKKRNAKQIKEAVERVSMEDGMVEYRKGLVDEAKKREKNKYADVGDEKNTPPVVENNAFGQYYANKEEDSHSESSIRENNRRILEKIAANPETVEKAPEKPAENVMNTAVPASEIAKVAEMTREPMKDTRNTTFDEVSLPSRGECYKSKKDKVRVSHLVAYDENLILSPGLYRNGTFLDHILKNKILDNINPDDLIQGDRDAIIIWLRAGGYGPMYPIKMTDEQTGEEFETEVDLSSLSFRKFTLTGDENGYFDFVLPKSKDVVKFKFLTAGDAKKLEKMRKEEEENISANNMRDNIRDIIDFIENSDKFTSKEGDNMIADLKDIEEVIYSRFKDAEGVFYTHDLTNRLVLSTMSVNGITDRNYIANYILNMNLKDAAEYRKYIIDNEPGIDYNIKVKRPDSLGGGYIDTFLQLDQFIFIY